MKRTILTSLFAVCTCAVIVGAQTPQTTTQSPPTLASQADQRAAGMNTITIEGCVQRNASASSTSGATGTAGSTASSFILEKAARPNARPDAASTTASASPVAIVSTYRLDADDAKLSPHVGHKVEITGSVETAMGTATAPAGSASSVNVANAPKLKVDAVKMIAANCAP